MKAQLTRRDLFSLLVRPFQPMAEMPAAVNGGRRALTPGRQPMIGTQEVVAIVQGRHCLALTSFCAVCMERCPVPGAMKSIGGMPMVMPEVCTGCGICQQVCPAPEKAILLRPRRRPAERVSDSAARRCGNSQAGTPALQK